MGGGLRSAVGGGLLGVIGVVVYKPKHMAATRFWYSTRA